MNAETIIPSFVSGILSTDYLLELVQWVGIFFLGLISQGMQSHVNNGNSEWKTLLWKSTNVKFPTSASQLR